MSAHASECEEADVGSLCDCDCAGARHAIRRTKGGVPGAGQVSKRAQIVARRDGRAAVVNNRAQASGRVRRAGGGVPPPPEPQRPGRTRTPGGLPDGKPDPVRTTTRPPRLTPTTKARLDKVRAGLPKTRADWQAAARDPVDDATRRRLDLRVEQAHDQLADVEAAQQSIIDEHVKKEAAKMARDKKGGWAYQPKEARLEAARRVAPHRAWDDPRWQALNDERYRAQLAVKDAERARDDAVKAGAYPVDAKTGLRMPTARLQAHLSAVRDAGRAALADAQAAWENNPPPPVRDAHALIAKHTAARDALAALQFRRSRLADIDNPNTITDRFSVPLPDGVVVIKSRQQFEELQTTWATELLSVGGADRLREARCTIAAHQSGTLLAMLGEHRDFTGRHTDVVGMRDPHAEPEYQPAGPRGDYRERLAVAERYFPADWIEHSNRRGQLKIASSGRAYYSPLTGLLSMNTDSPGDTTRDGGLNYIDEVNVHEMGHRMEDSVPGLTHLQFAYVRERGRTDDGSVEPITSLEGYKDKREAAQRDRWGHAYAGKSYEKTGPGGDDNPGDKAWEVFQTGLQDTFGRSSQRYGPTDDPAELQAFVIGALLTLGSEHDPVRGRPARRRH